MKVYLLVVCAALAACASISADPNAADSLAGSVASRLAQIVDAAGVSGDLEKR